MDFDIFQFWLSDPVFLISFNHVCQIPSEKKKETKKKLEEKEIKKG
jgi:hypothetical protein